MLIKRYRYSQIWTNELVEQDGKTIYKHFSDREFEMYEAFKKYPNLTNAIIPSYHGRTRIESQKVKGEYDRKLTLVHL